MNLAQEIIRMRRFLRDPDGKIWDRDLIVDVYNDAQRDFQQETGVLERVTILRVPPFFQISYQHSFEWSQVPDGATRLNRCLKQRAEDGSSYCYDWEAEQMRGANSGSSESGASVTQPWENFVGIETGEAVPLKFPDDFRSVKMLAYDRESLQGLTESKVSSADSDYKRRSGRPFGYYRDDDLSNQFFLYPKPSTIEWNDVKQSSVLPDYVYTYSWEGEDETYMAGTGQRFVRTSDDDYEYVFTWEEDTGTGNDSGMRGMFFFEFGASNDGKFAFVLYLQGELVEAPMGVMVRRTGTFMGESLGAVTSLVEDQNNVILIYRVNPRDLVDDVETGAFRVPMRKYVEYRVISRLYGANNDGRIQSLSDYWDYRYEVGKRLVQRYKNSQTNRKIQLRTHNDNGHRIRQRRHGRLPSSYPSV